MPMIWAPAGDADIRIAASVVAPHDLVARLAGLVAEARQAPVDLTVRRSAAPRPAASAAPRPVELRAERLHHLWGTVVQPPPERGRGLRGMASLLVRKVVARLTHWYMEPRWTAQHEIDAELARFATECVGELAAARAELSSMRARVDELEDDLRRLRASTVRAVAVPSGVSAG